MGSDCEKKLPSTPRFHKSSLNGMFSLRSLIQYCFKLWEGKHVHFQNRRNLTVKNQRNACMGVLFGKNVQAAVKVMFANSIPTLDIAKPFFAIPMDNNEPTHIRIFANFLLLHASGPI